MAHVHDNSNGAGVAVTSLSERIKGRTLDELGVVFDFLSGDRLRSPVPEDEKESDVFAFRSLLLDIEREATAKTKEPTYRVNVVCMCGTVHRGWLVGNLLPPCPFCGPNRAWKSWARVVVP